MKDMKSFQLLFLSFLVVQTSAYRRALAKKENSPFVDDLLAEESQNQGFVEDINFKSFFEDVGLKGSESAPEGVHLRRPSEGRQYGSATKQEEAFGFIPEDPLTGFEPAESRNRFTVVSSDDDFFAQESSPFEDFYKFDNTNPFAASRTHRDYLSPYSASEDSHRKVNFEDFGPPKGFFDHDFSADFGGQNKKEGDKRAAQETRSEPKFDGSETKKQDKKTKKCETVHRDGMTCEICKDDFGGFSEHCSHSLHSGKDQKYANSRRNSHEDVYNPLKDFGPPQPSQGGRASKKSASNDQSYSSETESKTASPTSVEQPEKSEQSSDNDEEKTKESTKKVEETKKTESSSLKSTSKPKGDSQSDSDNAIGDEKEVAVFAKKSPVQHHSFSHHEPKERSEKASSRGRKNNFYDNFPEPSSYKPHNFDYMANIDELIDTGLKDLQDHQKKLLETLPKKKPKKETKEKEAKPSKKDTIRQESVKDERGKNQQHLNQPRYKPLNPAENFQVLGKMVKQFTKKDRSNCKKRVTKKGMTCYVCPNKHGQVDEECMYENADPSKGVHMMYKEETSY